MPVYNATHTGQEIDAVVGNYLSVNPTTLVTNSALNTTLEDYLSVSDAANIYQPLISNTTDLTAKSLTVRPSSGEAIIQVADGTHYSDDTFSAKLDLNPSSGNHGIWSTGYLSEETFTSDPKWMLYRDNSGNIILNGTAESLINIGGRPTTANTMYGDGKLRYYLSSASMTPSTGYPGRDGFILHGAWDWLGGYDSQLCFANNGAVYYRHGIGSPDSANHTQGWSSWKTLAFEGAYGFVRGTASYTFDASTTTRELSVTLTTHGRPVFLAVSGDLNPTTADSAWFNIDLYLDSTQLCKQIAESHGNSWNIPFHCSYLTSCSAGSHTFKVKFTRGAGTFSLSEGGAIQAPNFSVFEI